MNATVDPMAAIEDALKAGERSAPKATVARRLGITERTVNRWMVAGLPAVRVGGKVYLAWSDLLAFLRRGTPALDFAAPKARTSREAIRILRSEGYDV